MSSRLFALIIGIEQYKSSHIWNLSSCADDALGVKRWLIDELRVPRENICLLLDDQASKQAIEQAFVNHLISNPAIEPGDAIIFYFAGHGSSVAAPSEWWDRQPRHVEMLCTYDHGCKSGRQRVSGITDWSLQTMLEELAEAKGDNITIILDSCFSPIRSRLADRLRLHTRWTPSTKICDDDLYAGLWRNALSRKTSSISSRGFHTSATSHVSLLACTAGGRSMEDKEGGRFTRALLDAHDSIPLHRSSYEDIIDHLKLPEGQMAVCVGSKTKRIVFNGTPFTSDADYVAASVSESNIRIDAGAIHGVVEGTELSFHNHNIHGSFNPILASLRVFEVHSTWSLTYAKQSDGMQKLPSAGFARITHWNNRTIPFRVYLKQTYMCFTKWWRLRKRLPRKSQQGDTLSGVGIARVSQLDAADLFIRRRCHDIVFGRRDSLITDNSISVVSLPCTDTKDDLKAIDAAARFHIHLHRKNSVPVVPLRVQVSMALHAVDEATWGITGPDLLNSFGKAKLTLDAEKNNVYALVLNNHSSYDLWPYLFWMDASGYVIKAVYHPSPALSSPPLKMRSTFTIGTDGEKSEALSFSLTGAGASSSGFLKLFLSSSYIPMGLVEQGRPDDHLSLTLQGASNETASGDGIWDSKIACVTVIRN